MEVLDQRQLLELRQKLKKIFRKNMHEESESVQFSLGEQNIRLPYDKNYGSFFGPSQPAISQRAVQEINNLLSFQPKCSPPVKGSSKLKLKINNTFKIQRIKESRDYSFLLSDEKSMPISEKKSPPNSSEGKPISLTCPMLSKTESNGRPKALPVATNLKKQRSLQEPNEPKVVQKQSVASSKPRMNKPILNQNLSQASCQEYHHPNKKRFVKQLSSAENDCSENEIALKMIRQMFNTKRFIGRDDTDIVRETTYDEINKEEKRSERLARKEDLEQLQLIEKEEQRQKIRKLEKKRKLHHQ